VPSSITQRLLRVLMPVFVLAATAVTTTATASGVVTINVSSMLGSKVLVSSNGLALYHDTAEKKGAIACVGACAKVWLPLIAGAHAKPQAGAGVSLAKLGTIKRPDGTLQVTYNGLALYQYARDKASHAKGQGLEGKWFAITPAGMVTRAAATASSGTSGSSSGVSAGGSGGSAPLPTTNCNPAVLVTDPNDPCYSTAH
jgi:predicted lipoprotein with Yx(FWY)xxD motif